MDPRYALCEDTVEILQYHTECGSRNKFYVYGDRSTVVGLTRGSNKAEIRTLSKAVREDVMMVGRKSEIRLDEDHLSPNFIPLLTLTKTFSDSPCIPHSSGLSFVLTGGF